MTGEHGEGRILTVVGDPQIRGIDDERLVDSVHDLEAVTSTQVDEVPGVEAIEIVERPRVGRAVPGEDDVAVEGYRRAEFVAGRTICSVEACDFEPRPADAPVDVGSEDG